MTTDLPLTNASLNQNVRTIAWSPLAENQAGAWAAFADFSDKTVHIFGVFNGATVTMQGSNDPLVLTTPDTAAAETLVDPQGNTIAKLASNMSQILENPLYIRPNVTGGDGSTAVSVIVSVRRN